MDFDVGQRLKSVRKSKGYTQRDVAAQAGVTNGMISLIESNKSSPSVSSLKKILGVFDLALSDFFEDDEDKPEKFFFRPQDFIEINPSKRFEGAESEAISALSIKKIASSESKDLLLLYEVYEAGADTGEEAYSHRGEEGGFVVEGRLLLEVDGETQVLQAGDGYLFDSSKPHRFRNVDKERCVLVSACTPASF